MLLGLNGRLSERLGLQGASLRGSGELAVGYYMHMRCYVIRARLSYVWTYHDL